jgi:hypothetical protein
MEISRDLYIDFSLDARHYVVIMSLPFGVPSVVVFFWIGMMGCNFF